MPDYWLDSNAFIQPKRLYYAFDIVPGFWTFIDTKAIDGLVGSSLAVHRELTRVSNDDLGEWVDQRRNSFFVEPDGSVQGWYAQVVR